MYSFEKVNCYPLKLRVQSKVQTIRVQLDTHCQGYTSWTKEGPALSDKLMHSWRYKYELFLKYAFREIVWVLAVMQQVKCDLLFFFFLVCFLFFLKQ